MRKYNLLFLFCAFFFISCQKKDTNIQLTQYQFSIPVLKLNSTNKVLLLKISLYDTLTETNVHSVIINTEGTSRLKDIERVSLYYCGQDSTQLNEKMLLFAESDNISQKIRLDGYITLSKRENYFWLSYTLKEDVDILNFICAKCEKVITNNGEAKIHPLNDPKKIRLGIALRNHLDDNVHTFRIPGLVTTNSGSLLAIYDARHDSSRDLQGDIDIGINRSTDEGNTWSPMYIAMDMGEWGGLPQKFNGVSDACILVDKNSENIFIAGLWMYGVLNPDGKWLENLNEQSEDWNHQWRNKGSQPGFDVKETSQFLVVKSTNDGKTWEEPVNLTSMCKQEEWWLWAPAPGNGITMTDGTLVFPTQGRDKNGIPFSNITYSKDGGITWKTSIPAYTNTTESAVVQLDNGLLMLNMRNNRNRTIKGPKNGRAITTTTDLGETWQEHPSSQGALQESVCMASLLKHTYLENGDLKSVLIFSNPNIQEGPRRKTTIKISFDNGITWPEKNWMLLDEGNSRGYSCLTSIDEKTIGILYEGSQSDLIFQKISLEDLIK